MLCVGFLFEFFFSKSSKSRLGWREGMDGPVGFLVFFLQKTGLKKQTNKQTKIKGCLGKQQKLMGKCALEGLSGQALCGGGGRVQCLHDILYHKILIRMFLTCFFPLHANKSKDFV